MICYPPLLSEWLIVPALWVILFILAWQRPREKGKTAKSYAFDVFCLFVLIGTMLSARYL